MKTNYCCVCGENKLDLNNHHFVPKSLGGSDDEKNIITLCVNHHNFIHKMERKLNLNYLMKLSKQKMKKEGKFLGGRAPFGFKRIKNSDFLKFNKKEIHIIKQIKLLKDQGHTYRSIANNFILNPRTNKEFDCGFVFRILKKYQKGEYSGK